MSVENGAVLGAATATGAAVAGAMLGKTGSLYTYALVFAGAIVLVVSVATLLKNLKRK